MLYWAALFFIIAMIAAMFAAGAHKLAMWIFWLFIMIFLVTLIIGLIQRSRK